MPLSTPTKAGRARRAPRRSGHTILEVVIAAGLSVVALTGVSALLIGGTSSWIMGEAKVDAVDSAEQGVRIVSNALRSAMSVTIDPGGNGITYELPQVDDNGNYVSPAVWDGVTRRFALSGSDLVETDGAKSRTIVEGVSLQDPLSQNGTGTYEIFTPGVGATVREVTVEIVATREGVNSLTANSRNRETIYLRNVPQIIR